MFFCEEQTIRVCLSDYESEVTLVFTITFILVQGISGTGYVCSTAIQTCTHSKRESNPTDLYSLV